jgi:hypothetical protein
MTDSVTGIPSIPAGAQLGGAGAAENQAQAQPQYQATPDPVAPAQEPQTAPVPQVPQAGQEVLKTNETVQVNPYKDTDTTGTEAGATYVETSIKHLSGELGVTSEAFDSVIENALKHGDISLINPHALGKDLTPEQTIRVQQLAQAAVQEVQQGIQNAKNTAYNVAGGEAEWNTAVGAFNANAPQDIQEYVSFLADRDITKAANYVINYNKQGGYVNQEVQAPIGGGTGNVSTGLSAAEYSSEIGKIEREAGNRSLGSPQFAQRIADIDARRTLGRQQGK